MGNTVAPAQDGTQMNAGAGLDRRRWHPAPPDRPQQMNGKPPWANAENDAFDDELWGDGGIDTFFKNRIDDIMDKDADDVVN